MEEQDKDAAYFCRTLEIEMQPNCSNAQCSPLSRVPNGNFRYTYVELLPKDIILYTMTTQMVDIFLLSFYLLATVSIKECGPKMFLLFSHIIDEKFASLAYLKSW